VTAAAAVVAVVVVVGHRGFLKMCHC